MAWYIVKRRGLNFNSDTSATYRCVGKFTQLNRKAKKILWLGISDN
jgi:hypothetical protein